jgi:hypothetical protein
MRLQTGFGFCLASKRGQAHLPDCLKRAVRYFCECTLATVRKVGLPPLACEIHAAS